MCKFCAQVRKVAQRYMIDGAQVDDDARSQIQLRKHRDRDGTSGGTMVHSIDRNLVLYVSNSTESWQR
jgi:hypothetical protein